jgi:CubicO group peptidase (beta-lactamase class C family)
MKRTLFLHFGVALAVMVGAFPKTRAQAGPDYAPAIRMFEAGARAEMSEWGITGISAALIDDQRVVHAAGFGEAKRDSAFRCGSISKLFNAVAVMQLVEQGKLDLDAPLEQYAAEILPVNPFATNGPMTLRQLLCHRSGIVRESPVGGYLDGSGPGFARMIASVRQTVLPTAPNARLRYSNVGPSLAGHIVARVAGTEFERYQRDHILGPLGMNDSAWRFKDLRRGQLVPANMRVADGRGGFTRRRSPVFDLGTLPAGNLFTTAEDLARFVSMLAAGGRAPDGSSMLKPETLEQMFTPQLISGNSGFGLGFSIGTFQDRKTVGHSGAVYGFSSSLVFLPAEKLGIVVLGNEDIVSGRIQMLANLGLARMLEAKFGEKPPPPPESLALSAEELAAFAGDYESPSFWARLAIEEGRLIADISGQPTKFRAVEPLRFLADSALYNSAPVMFERAPSGVVTGFRLAGQDYARVPKNPAPAPPEWRRYFGSYGPSFIPLVVSERHGHLYAMTENMVDYRLTPVNQYVFELPPGMYVNEHLVFFPDNDGRPRSVSLAGMILKRR